MHFNINCFLIYIYYTYNLHFIIYLILFKNSTKKTVNFWRVTLEKFSTGVLDNLYRLNCNKI